VTYADTEEIRSATAQKGLNTRRVAMYTTQGATKHALLIAKDLSWVEKVSR